MRPLRAAFAAAALLVAFVPDPGHAGVQRSVSMPGAFYDPRHLVALPGDTVVWTNRDAQAHDVTGSGFSSPRLVRNATFAHTFNGEGVFPYHCSIHIFMSGKVTVTPIWLEAPTAPIRIGRSALLRGLVQPGTAVTIEQVFGDGRSSSVAQTVAAADGRFAATVSPRATARYRAVAGTLVSPPVTVRVSPKVAVAARRVARAVLVSVSTIPPQSGATVTLQRFAPARSAWVRIARRRLDARSTARFRLVPRTRMRVRAALTRPVRGFAPGASRSLVVRP